MRLHFGDGPRKALAVASTAPLPRRLRVAARERLLARLELSKSRRARLIIIGHPKSGNTWLKVMLSRLYQVRHDLPASVIAGSDELALRNDAVPRLSATNGHYSYEGVVGRLLAVDAADSPLRHKPVVFLARHPGDIAVSWYFQFTRRQSRHKQELINHFIERPIDRRRIEMWDFVRHSDIGLPFLIEYLNTWQQNVTRLEHGLLVRYEDLRAEPADALSRITELMGESFGVDEIEEAVRFGSFENLRKLESEGFFRQAALRLRDSGDPESFKVRRGKVNGYRDYFTAEQADELDELVTSKLSPAFGYGRAAEIPAPSAR